MKNLLILLLLPLLAACKHSEVKNDTVETPVSAPAEQSKTADTISTIQNNEQKGDTILMNFKDKNGIYNAESILASNTAKVYVKFRNEESGEVKAVIIPDAGKVNIRFNQIIAPDKSSDGPFGMKLETTLGQKGNYIFVIGHSQMADNPYVGKFKIQLEYKKSAKK